MKKILIVAAVLLTLPGCFAKFDNPVTATRVATLNASWGAALTLANGYYDSCEMRVIPQSCRTVVAKLHAVAPSVQDAVVKAREFAKQPELGSTDLIAVAFSAVNKFKTLQTNLGVK